jgi:hypothetical protein
VTISASWPASADQTHMRTFDVTLRLPRICLSFTCVAGTKAAPNRPTQYTAEGWQQALVLLKEDTSAEIVIPTCLITSLELGAIRCPVAMPPSTRARN